MPGRYWGTPARFVRAVAIYSQIPEIDTPSDDNREFFKGMKYDENNQDTDGPVQVSFGVQYMPFHSAWLETSEALGYPQLEDPINGSGTGPFVTPGAIDPVSHTRSHSSAAYLGQDVQARPNLRVVMGGRLGREGCVGPEK